ncbi:putative serine/threonine-protein kinase-like protein CCR3 [Phoenix dactylifera]|uniref:Serine/threonine-protein kinase-like protein CCR3 n=1 Tax=Phoenix dactylifera TaxID=42345 RepID=A0A8B7C7A2_PHODC|nr:putative serine/threonine-protein kinase-like protein CCR3 [Phoenix dactylifera]
MRLPVTAAAGTIAVVLIALFSAAADGLGSAATVAISHGTDTVCGVLAGNAPRSIQCARGTQPAFSISSNVSFDSVSGGRDFLCGLKSGGTAFFCWDASNASSTDFPQKRVYSGPALTDLTVGENQIAAIDRNGTAIRWWRGGGSFPRFNVSRSYRSLTSGRGFSCAIDANNTVRCWGGVLGEWIQGFFSNASMASIVAGDFHVCGLNTTGFLVCRGINDYGQLDAPSGPAFEFSSLALGASQSCAVRQANGTVVCWGGGGGSGTYAPVNATSFLFIVAGGDLTCGLTTMNFSVVCWGTNRSKPAVPLSLGRILPGICTADQSSCTCDIVPDSASLCSGSGVICRPCLSPSSPPPSPSPSAPPPPLTSRKTSKGWLAFAIVGSVGAFSGACTIIYCLWTGVCRNKKVHNSVQPTITAAENGGSNAGATSGAGAGGLILSSPFTSTSGSGPRIFRRQGSRVMRRQRSGPSSFKDRAEEFTFAELAAATKNFSLETKIGAGSFGTVYKGKLPDGREVAIKRSESGPRTKKFQEKESAFQSELAFLSRLHHKHLVGLVGYCEEQEERLLVYEYMKNGALYDHLHSKDNNSTVLNSWKMRIKVLLDAARGIEYLHNYAVPPIIHRDIKSSNILLDGNWVARVSDFGLSLMEPESNGGHLSTRAAGTVGYMDPEYYGLHHLTVKSDVYGLGVVMLEVLTGKRAIFKDEEEGKPISVVDYAVPSIVAAEVARVLDARVPMPGPHEAEAVELVAYTAVHCVSLEGRERPFAADIVANLESALALCEDSHGSISSISLASVD